MKKKTFLIIGIVVLFIVIGGMVFLNKTIEDATGEKVNYIESIKMVFTLNFDSQLEKELKQERNKIKHEHVSIFYLDGYEEFLPITKEALTKAIEANETILGEYKKRAVDLILFRSTEELTKMSDLVDVSGFYSDFDKVIGIDVDANSKKENALYFYEFDVMHEYTHYAFRQRLVDIGLDFSIVPIWFEEGLCDFVFYQQTGTSYSKYQFTPIPFSDLSVAHQWFEGRNKDNSNVYGQSYLAINYLIDEYGVSIINNILLEAKKEDDFERGFTAATGLRVNELDDVLVQNYFN